MRSCCCVLTFLAGTIVCFSGELPRLRWAKDAPNCDYLIENDKYVEIVRVDGLEIRVAVDDTGRKMRAQVAVSNGSSTRIDLTPELFTLNVIEPKPRVLKREAPEKITRSIQRSAAWQTFGASMGSGATKQTTSQSQTNGDVSVSGAGGTARGTYNGTTTTTTTEPDYEARRRAAEQIEDIRARRDAEVARIEGAALRANTLVPGQSIEGAVYFEREKRHDLVIFGITLGSQIFEFPFRWRKK